MINVTNEEMAFHNGMKLVAEQVLRIMRNEELNDSEILFHIDKEMRVHEDKELYININGEDGLMFCGHPSDRGY